MTTIESRQEVENTEAVIPTPKLLIEQQLDCLRGLLISAMHQIDAITLMLRMPSPKVSVSTMTEPEEEDEIPPTFGSRQ